MQQAGHALAFTLGSLCSIALVPKVLEQREAPSWKQCLQQLKLPQVSSSLVDIADRGGAAGRPGGYHAILVPAGGQQPEGGPPRHVALRLERAVELYRAAAEPKPWIITTAWGTPHKPCPHDKAGFERHESADNAAFLLARGVPASHLLEESASLETVGNALYARLLHTDPLGLRRLAVVNNRWHMPRTRAVFGHVFGVPPAEGAPAPSYELDFVEVEDGLAPDVLQARLKKEEASLPKFLPNGSWQNSTRSLQDLHRWLHQENTAYSASRLLVERKPLDPQLLKSY